MPRPVPIPFADAPTNPNKGDDAGADNTKPGPNAKSSLSTAAVDPQNADHTKGSKKTNEIVLNGILHKPFQYTPRLTVDTVEPPNNDTRSEKVNPEEAQRGSRALASR